MFGDPDLMGWMVQIAVEQMGYEDLSDVPTAKYKELFAICDQLIADDQ